MIRMVIAFGCLLAPGLLGTSGVRAKVEMGRVEITVVDRATGKPVPCRVHLKDAKGKGLKADGLPFWNQVRRDKSALRSCLGGLDTIDIAQKAVDLCPKQAMYWKTLGVAQYRAGHWKDRVGHSAGIRQRGRARRHLRLE